MPSFQVIWKSRTPIKRASSAILSRFRVKWRHCCDRIIRTFENHIPLLLLLQPTLGHFYSKHLKYLFCTHLHISSLHVTIIDLINVFSTWLRCRILYFKDFIKFRKRLIKMDVHDFDDNASMMSSSTMATSTATGQVWNLSDFCDSLSLTDLKLLSVSND